MSPDLFRSTGLPPWRMAAYVALACLGVALVVSPALVTTAAIVFAYAMLLMCVPVHYMLAVAVVVTLGFPWDFLVPLTESRGLVEVVAWFVTAAMMAVRVRRIGLPRLGSYADMFLMLAVLLTSTLVTFSAGGARGGLVVFAVGTGALVTYLLTPAKKIALEAVGAALLAIGGIHGAVSGLEQLFGGTGSLIGAAGWYHPTIRAFSDTLGLRASGFLGHPLRLGTLTGLGLAYWASRAGTLKMRMSVHVPLALLCLLGLVLSGARGAWLATAAVVAALGLLYTARLRVRRIGWMTAVLGVVALTASVSGIAGFAIDRLLGAASDPTSLGHRLTLLQVAATAWRTVPLAGFGWTGAEVFVLGQGAVLSTIENEYLRLFLAAGPISLLLFTLAAVRSSWRAWRSSVVSDLGVFVMSALLFVLVNLGTYNMMSWSGAAAIVFVFLGAARSDS